jgi:gliding motility-associated-like protein
MPGPQMSVLTQAASCADDDGTLNIQAGGGTAPLLYSLDGINFQTTPQFTGLPFGNKTPMVKDANGCTVSRSVVVSVDDDLYLNGATASPICQGTSTTLAISSNASSFTWTPADGLNDPTAKLPVASPDASTTYQVTAKTGSCELTTTVSVLVNPAPVADARAGQTICYGESADLQGSGGTTYNWSPATGLDDPQSATPTVQKPDQDMTYRLTVTDDNGCSSLNDARVAITVTPPAAVFASRDTAILNGQSLQLQAIDINQVGFIQYSWSPSMGLDNTAISNPVATISGDIQYLVTATTIAGCTGSDTVNIKSFSVSNIFVPNAFTPDGNGRNDYLKPVLIGIKQMQYFKVFNRWGQQVFSASVAIPGWDGLINGQKQDTGTYVWSAGGIDYQDRAIQRQGTVVLIR